MSSAGAEAVVRAAGVIVGRTDGQRPRLVLLRARRGGHWTPPKGHLEPGEDALAGALRELEEETGIRPDELAFVPGWRRTLHYEVVERGRRRPKRVDYFLARWRRPGELRLSSEHDAFAWWDRDEIASRTPFDNLRALLLEAEQALAERARG